MISNPGQAQSSTTMLTTTYDTTNKKQDIFTYTDSKVADKVTSAQVASQISSATANFVTSAQVDAKIKTSEDDRFKWHSVVAIPFSSDYTTPTTLNSDSATHVVNRTSGSNTYTYYYYLVALPVPIYAKTYCYQIQIEYVGLKCTAESNSTLKTSYLEFVQSIPTSSSYSLRGGDYRGLPITVNTADTTLRYMANVRVELFTDISGKCAFQKWGTSMNINGNSASTTDGYGNGGNTDIFDYQGAINYIGWDLGSIRTMSGTTYNSKEILQSYGMVVSYRALS